MDQETVFRGGELKPWFLYILRCRDGSLYTGISPDPQARLKAHQSGKGAAYTRAHKPVAMVFCERVGSHSKALKREYKVKSLDRKGKLKLVGGE
jgi:putative endonuclease